MATTPKVNRSSGPVVRNKQVMGEFNGGEKVVFRARGEKAGPDGQKGDIKGPKFFKGRFDRKDKI